jgi:hypothetical protein
MGKAGHIALALLVAVGMIFFGLPFSSSAYHIMREWRSVGAGLAACGVLWTLAGPPMFVAGWWVLGTLGRKRIPLWMGGSAAVVVGASLVAGVLTRVIPCSSPS